MEHCPVSADLGKNWGEKLGQASFGGLGKLLPSYFGKLGQALFGGLG